MKINYFETILGSVILLIAITFLFNFLNTNKSNLNDEDYALSAKFLKIGGLVIGNDVKLRGVKVGTVSNIKLDSEYFAVVDFIVDDKVFVPKDSLVSIHSDGLLGNKYLSIIPGNIDNGRLNTGGMIENVVDFESIEDQVSKIIFLATQ
tara:strand:+ start:161 stop:607 length:447 start_codon:yes stop_codon:yes gene_type:complete